MIEFTSPAYFCKRHKNYKDCIRCAHLENRFIYWSSEFQFVDYVEDLDNGDVIVEHHYCSTQESQQAFWDKLITKMLNNVPPDPDGG